MTAKAFLPLNSEHGQDLDMAYDNNSEISTHRDINFLYTISDPSGVSTADILKGNVDHGFLILNANVDEEPDEDVVRDRLGQSSTHEPMQLFLYGQDEPFSDEPEQL